MSTPYAGVAREQIPHDHPEFAKRTLQLLQHHWGMLAADDKDFVATFDKVRAARLWEWWPLKQPYGSLDSLCQAELGTPLRRVFGAVEHAGRAASDGHWRAIASRAGLRQYELDRAHDEFSRLESDGARAAYADKWLGLNSGALKTTWPMLYELLRIVRDKRLYAQLTIDRKVTYPTFEAYFEAYFGEGFERFVEFENTYRFAEQYTRKLTSADEQGVAT